MARSASAYRIPSGIIRRFLELYLLARIHLKGLAQLAHLWLGISRLYLSDVVGLAPVLYHGQPVASDLFDRLYGVLGAPFNAAHPALYRNYNGYSEADT